MPDEIVGFIDAYKGVKLFYKAYASQNSFARIVFLHGAGEYSAKYERFCKWFADKGVEVFIFDLRGHGSSGGAVCHVDNFNDYTFDLDVFLKHIDRGWGHKKTFLTAHSLGSLIAIFYSINFSYTFKGMVLCSPCLALRLKIEPVKAWFAVMFYKILGNRPFASHIKPRMATHDKFIIDRFIDDPLIHHVVTAGFYIQMARAMRYARSRASGLKDNLLILQAGDDKICDRKVVENFYRDAGSDDKELKLYRGLYHELLNEVDRQMVFEDIYNWIRKRC